MNRQIVYPASIPLDTDFLSSERFAMIAQGYLAQAMLGTSVAAWGLACNPTSPASLTVTVGPGAMTAYTEVDTSAFGSLPADTNPLVKMGVNEAATSFTLTAPGTSGQSINYLIEGQFQETDAVPVVLPYVNAANPSQPYSGPNNSGAAQDTVRTQIVGLQLKAGAPANTGTQTTPGADAGWSPLYVITVNYGQTTITSAAITVAPGAPFVAASQVTSGRLLGTPKAFSASGTYTPSAGINYAIIAVQGSGGAGGSCSGNGAWTGSSGGGGCAGSLAVVSVSAATLGASQSIVIGAGGTPAVAGTNRGGTGSTTSFGSLVSIAGSTGGAAGAAQAVGGSYAADGGTSGAITINSGATEIFSKPGRNGETGLAICSVAVSEVLYGGSGSETNYGQGGGRTGANTNGAPGTNGGGGSGGCSGINDGGGRVGGAGGAGLVIVWEYS